MCDHLGVGRQAFHPQVHLNSAFAATASEKKGLHARPFPRTFGEHIFVDVAYHGGGRIGALLPLHIGEVFSGRRRDRPFSSQKR